MDLQPCDIDLLFPPQWSPFQPPLSLPALKAWLSREGFSCALHDANVDFYHWLFSSEARRILERRLAARTSDIKTLGYRAVLARSDDFLEDFRQLSERPKQSRTDRETVQQVYRSVKSLQTYLSVVSSISGEFEITPYSFKTTADMLRLDVINQFVENPPDLIDSFVNFFCATKLRNAADSVGISCIGQEQLLFTLLFAQRLARIGRKVVVGGTILSRMQQRGLLPASWFEHGITVIVHNEGERPLTKLLHLKNWTADQLKAVDGITFLNQGKLVTTKSAAALTPAEVPVPDFDGFPLARYLTPEITLPILSSRGCYWGHCEFCHHGMVYGEKYSTYSVDAVIDTINKLSVKYGVKYFSFNDEAVPPKIMRALGNSSIVGQDLRFQALFKFEKYYTKLDFQNLFSAGFRSLYVGLESANERVLASMRKNTKKEVITGNLQHAAGAGIWVHCFLFFGFPGELEEEAKETSDYILQNSNIIGSFGAGNFELEYGAPISKHVADFPLKLNSVDMGRVDVYADYEPTQGIPQWRAAEIASKLHLDALSLAKYRSVNWVPRELFLILLSEIGANKLIEEGDLLFKANDVIRDVSLRDFISVHRQEDVTIFINRLNRRIVSVSSITSVALQAAYAQGWSPQEIDSINPHLMSGFASQESRSA